jgi:hypothetical protein
MPALDALTTPFQINPTNTLQRMCPTSMLIDYLYPKDNILVM